MSARPRSRIPTAPRTEPPQAAHDGREERQRLDLVQGATTLVDECRMVLPGIQALFGFQLIVVFNERFTQLAPSDQLTHVAAIGLVALAVALVMTPAAYHRSHGSREISDTFIHVCSLLLLASMAPLAVGLSLDFHLIVKLVTGSQAAAISCGFALFALLFLFWFVFPRAHRLHARLAAFRKRNGHR